MPTENTQTEQPVLDDLFISVKNILESDSNLCNMSRYMDYGKFIKDPYDSYKVLWKTVKDTVNKENCQNNTQIVRFVDRIDNRFLAQYRTYNNCLNSIMNSAMFLNGCRRIPQYSSNSSTGSNGSFTEYVLSNMINIDCTLKVSGSSLTALDFVYKNPLNTREEYAFYSDIGRMVTKYIFLGDKCFILAFIDNYHNVYINKKLLLTIMTKEKTKFPTIVKNLFKIIARYSFHFMNASITQYFVDQIMSPVMLMCACNGEFDKLKTDSDFKKIMTFKFSEDQQIDSDVKSLIVPVIEKMCKRYIEKYYDFSTLDFPSMVNDMKENLRSSIKELTKRAYINGMNLSNLFRLHGWTYCDMIDESKKVGQSLHYISDCVYIKKEVNMVPRLAYMYMNRGNSSSKTFRKLNNDGVNAIAVDYHIIIKNLYINITKGTMLMAGRHPNVSGGGEVCMGDIKGTISFDNCEPEKVVENLDKCEHLLDTINYTSSYTADGERIFGSDTYAFNVEDEFKQEKAKTESEIDNDLSCSDVEDTIDDEDTTVDDEIDDSLDGVEDAE